MTSQRLFIPPISRVISPNNARDVSRPSRIRPHYYNHRMFCEQEMGHIRYVNRTIFCITIFKRRSFSEVIFVVIYCEIHPCYIPLQYEIVRVLHNNIYNGRHLMCVVRHALAWFLCLYSTLWSLLTMIWYLVDQFIYFHSNKFGKKYHSPLYVYASLRPCCKLPT